MIKQRTISELLENTRFEIQAVKLCQPSSEICYFNSRRTFPTHLVLTSFLKHTGVTCKYFFSFPILYFLPKTSIFRVYCRLKLT